MEAAHCPALDLIWTICAIHAPRGKLGQVCDPCATISGPNDQVLFNARLRDDPALLCNLSSRQITSAYEVASEHSPWLCSNPRLDEVGVLVFWPTL